MERGAEKKRENLNSASFNLLSSAFATVSRALSPGGNSTGTSSSSTFFKVGKDVLAQRLRRRLLRASEAHRQMPKGKKAQALKQLKSSTC